MVSFMFGVVCFGFSEARLEMFCRLTIISMAVIVINVVVKIFCFDIFLVSL